MKHLRCPRCNRVGVSVLGKLLLSAGASVFLDLPCRHCGERVCLADRTTRFQFLFFVGLFAIGGMIIPHADRTAFAWVGGLAILAIGMFSPLGSRR